MGLGLHIVLTLVRTLGGRVRARGRYDGPGTVFEVTLPAISTESQEQHPTAVARAGKAEVA